MTDLLDLLTEHAEENDRASKLWPKSANYCGQTLRRFGKPLRECGIDVDVDHRSVYAEEAPIGPGQGHPGEEKRYERSGRKGPVLHRPGESDPCR